MIDRRSLTRALVCVLVALAGAHAAHGAAPVKPEALVAASSDFKRGLEIVNERPLEARDAFASAAERYAQLAAGEPSYALRYNEGTAWLRAGDAGRAIVAFRRAERLGGRGDPRLAGNLALARARVRTDAGLPGAGALATAAQVAPPGWLAGVGAGLFSLGWVLASMRLTGMRVPVLPIAGSWVVAVACLALFIAGDRDRGDASLAVVIAQETTARQGPDDGAYEPAFTAPLTSGVELRIVEERAGWARIALADGREAWVPRAAVERI